MGVVQQSWPLVMLAAASISVDDAMYMPSAMSYTVTCNAVHAGLPGHSASGNRGCGSIPAQREAYFIAASLRRALLFENKSLQKQYSNSSTVKTHLADGAWTGAAHVLCCLVTAGSTQHCLNA
jgi:hypothetical protein